MKSIILITSCLLTADFALASVSPSVVRLLRRMDGDEATALRSLRRLQQYRDRADEGDLGRILSRFNLTYEQLLEKRFLSGVTAEFLSAMDWSWYELSGLLYPKDSKQAARFIAHYDSSMLEEKVQRRMLSALQAKQTEFPHQASTIDNFLEELPTLVSKEKFMKTEQVGLQRRNFGIEEDESILLRQAKENFSKDKFRWSYGPSARLWSYGPAARLLADASALALLKRFASQRRGWDYKQVADRILTPGITRKFMNGEIYDEQDLAILRRKINDENFKEFLTELVASNDQLPPDILGYVINMEKMYFGTPWIVQLDGFWKKIASGVSSDRELMAVLKNVEKNSFYRPFAVDVLDTAKRMSQTEQTKFFAKIRAAIRENERFVPVSELSRGGNQELPVSVPKPIRSRSPVQKQNKHAARSRAPGKPAKQDDLAKLVSGMGRGYKEAISSGSLVKSGLSNDVPVWKRLRAILRYAGTNVEDLAKRTAVRKNIGNERLYALVADDATELPSEGDLKSIHESLRSFINGKKKRSKKLNTRERAQKRKKLDIVSAAINELLEEIRHISG